MTSSLRYSIEREPKENLWLCIMAGETNVTTKYGFHNFYSPGRLSPTYIHAWVVCSAGLTKVSYC